MTKYARSSVAMLLFLGVSGAACAQQESANGSSSRDQVGGEKKTDRVVIRASKEDYDPRRDDTASKIVLNKDEIAKYGDTNVFDILKRAPGVTVVGSSIRMRGLGAGYTQILVNGELPPLGFNLEVLPPEQIERIEIMRSATAEFSMQAIAGTINIVLKRTVTKPERNFRLGAVAAKNNKNIAASGLSADKFDGFSYTVNGTVSRTRREPESIAFDQLEAPNSEVTELRQRSSRELSNSTQAIMQPRLIFKVADANQINVGGFIQFIHSKTSYRSETTDLLGTFETPDYVRNQSDSSSNLRYFGFDVDWAVALAGGKFNTKASINKGNVEDEERSLFSAINYDESLLRETVRDARYTTYTSSGKYTRSILDGHNLVTGWEINYRRVDDQWLRVDRTSDMASITVNEIFRPETTRVAFFAQDEWNVTKQLSMYLGARWEGIRTVSSATGLETARSRNDIVSPVAQTLYKFPDNSGRQLRFAVSRTFKAPTVSQLSAHRDFAALNTRFTPDSSGNPELRPELATGLDVTYEHYWAAGALYSIGVSSRRITDYIRTKLIQDVNGLSLNQPINDGKALVNTLSLELKMPLRSVWKGAPLIDVRASANRNWSKVHAVPGPDNRIDEQVPFNAVLGFDYKGETLSAGASFAFRSGGSVRPSEEQSLQLYRRRDLDVYVMYKLSSTTQLRVTGANLFAEDDISSRRYRDNLGTSQTWSLTRGARRLQVSLDSKF